MKISDLLNGGARELVAFHSARLDAELLLSRVLGKPLTFLLAHDETEIGFFTLWRYRRLVAKRKTGIPIAYLLGHKEFYFLDFEVNKHVLIPRPDTEILVDSVVSYLNDQLPRPYRTGTLGRAMTNDQCNEPLLLDIGTGSGCIPISILKNVEGLKAVATDISSKALSVAKRNVAKHHLKSRIRLFRSNLMESIPDSVFHGKEVVLTANLPYIPVAMELTPETKFEPTLALYGGMDGLDIYRKLLEQCRKIQPKAIFLEAFSDQIAILAAEMPEYNLKFSKILSGKAMMMHLERKR